MIRENDGKGANLDGRVEARLGRLQVAFADRALEIGRKLTPIRGGQQQRQKRLQILLREGAVERAARRLRTRSGPGGTLRGCRTQKGEAEECRRQQFGDEKS